MAFYKCDNWMSMSDATATASDIAAGKTAYVNRNKITGTLNAANTKNITASTADFLYLGGYFSCHHNTIAKSIHFASGVRSISYNDLGLYLWGKNENSLTSTAINEQPDGTICYNSTADYTLRIYKSTYGIDVTNYSKMVIHGTLKSKSNISSDSRYLRGCIGITNLQTANPVDISNGSFSACTIFNVYNTTSTDTLFRVIDISNLTGVHYFAFSMVHGGTAYITATFVPK